MTLAKLLDLIRFISIVIASVGFWLLKKGLITETGWAIYVVLIIPSLSFVFTCLFPMIYIWGGEFLENRRKNNHR